MLHAEYPRGRPAVDQPLDLYFGTFETMVTVMTSVIVFFIVQVRIARSDS